MIADSGCQISTIPFGKAAFMGYEEEHIIPVSLSMKGAIKEDLGVKGGIKVEVGSKDNTGMKRSCMQLLYLSKKMTKAFLCIEAKSHQKLKR